MIAVLSFWELKSRNFSSWARMPSRFVCMSSSFLGFAGGVSDHAGPSAHQGYGFVPQPLHVRHHHYLLEAADVEARRGGVEPHVKDHHPLFAKFSYLRVGQLADEAPFFQRRYGVRHILSSIIVEPRHYNPITRPF